jgi:hypothetical protein
MHSGLVANRLISPTAHNRLPSLRTRQHLLATSAPPLERVVISTASVPCALSASVKIPIQAATSHLLFSPAEDAVRACAPAQDVPCVSVLTIAVSSALSTICRHADGDGPARRGLHRTICHAHPPQADHAKPGEYDATAGARVLRVLPDGKCRQETPYGAPASRQDSRRSPGHLVTRTPRSLRRGVRRSGTTIAGRGLVSGGIECPRRTGCPCAGGTASDQGETKCGQGRPLASPPG